MYSNICGAKLKWAKNWFYSISFGWDDWFTKLDYDPCLNTHFIFIALYFFVLKRKHTERERCVFYCFRIYGFCFLFSRYKLNISQSNNNEIGPIKKQNKKKWYAKFRLSPKANSIWSRMLICTLSRLAKIKSMHWRVPRVLCEFKPFKNTSILVSSHLSQYTNICDSWSKAFWFISDEFHIGSFLVHACVLCIWVIFKLCEKCMYIDTC